MSEMKDGGPAFPVLCDYVNGKPRGMQTANSGGWHEGLSLRDYFAAAALQGLLACSRVHEILPSDGNVIENSTAKWAYGFANTMLEARKVSQ